jgi:hypothetical protein
LRTTLFCLAYERSPLWTHVSRAASSRDDNARKKCQPHKNDAIPFEHD